MRVHGRRLKVLVVDDDEGHAQSLRSAVEDLGHACRAATGGRDAWDLHRAEPFDVVLCDWRMPEMDGLELCRKIRTECSAVYTYFILVTGHAEKVYVVLGLREGADDYLTKPVNLDELEVRLESAVRGASANRRPFRRTESLERDSERALEVARLDPLTDRAGLDAELARTMAQAARYGHRHSLGLCDVDWFKRYNDTFGHLAGDEVLRRAVEAMRSGLREGERIFRYGGEEFLVLFPEQTLEDAAIVMDGLRRNVEGLGIRYDSELPAPIVTVSAGVAELDPETDLCADDWLQRADVALCRARERGRNCVAF